MAKLRNLKREYERERTPEEIAKIELDSLIIHYRLRLGYPVTKIAQLVCKAHNYVRCVIDAYIKERQRRMEKETEALLALELAKLDEMLPEIENLIRSGSEHIRVKGITLYLQYSESRRKLLGADNLKPSLNITAELNSLSDDQLDMIANGVPVEKVLSLSKVKSPAPNDDDNE